MPSDVTVYQAATRLPLVQIGKTGFKFSHFVEEMGAVMRAVGVSGMQGDGAFHIRFGTTGLSGFHLSEGQHAEKPPIVAVMRCETFDKGQMFCLPARPASESDQPEDAEARLHHKGVAGIFR